MHRLLLASSATLALVAASSASAQTVIDTRRTTAVRTSTVKNSAADNISIGSAGNVVPISGTAVTIDGNNTVANVGTVQVTEADGAIGILAQAGVQSTITNTGKIIVDEGYAPIDADDFGEAGRTAGSTTAQGEMVRTVG